MIESQVLRSARRIRFDLKQTPLLFCCHANKAIGTGHVMRCLAAAQVWPGGTLWELLYTGCVVLSYTRNPLQASVTKTLAKRNILADLGKVPGFQGPALIATLQELRASASKRKSMAEAGRRDALALRGLCYWQ